MALDGGTAVVNVIANGAGLSKSIAAATQKGLQEAQGPIAAAGAKLTSFLTSPLTLIGAGAVAVVAKLGFEFESAFTKISAVSNASADDIANWREQVLQLSGETAQAPQELADALFFLASAGLETSQVMEVLESSAQASAVGLGDTADIARLTANVLNAYAESGITAAEVTDQLVAAVREGTADTDEFVGAIGRILPIAARAGVGFDQIVGSLAALSNIGLDVNEGVTALRGLLQSIVAPTEQSQAALKKLHITTEELRTTLSEEGLPGALNLLEDASKGNIDVLRELIPNIRALTGELGLTGENADQVALIMIATANAAGSLGKALAETQQGPAFQFQQAVNDIRVAGTELGTQVLPAVTKAIEFLGPILEFAAKNAAALGIAFLTWKVIQGLSGLLASLAVSLQATATGATATTAAITEASVAMGGFTVATAAATAGIGLLALAISQANLDEVLMAQLEPAIQGTADLAQAAELASRTGLTFEEAFKRVQDAAKNVAKETSVADEVIGGMSRHLDKAGHSVRNFAGMTNKALKEFRADTIENFSNVAGTVSDTGAVFTLTAQEIVKGVQRMAKAQQRMADDLAKLDELPIGDKLKERLIELGPQAVDGFVRGSAKQRNKIRAGLRSFDSAAEDTVKAVTKITSSGGQDAGVDMAIGLATGMREGTGFATSAATTLGNETLAALRASLDIRTPSHEAEKIGFQIMQGLALGMSKNFREVTEVLKELVPLMRKAIGQGAADQASSFLRDLEAMDKRFERLKTRIGNFRSAIRGAFTDAADLIGGIGAALEQFRQDQEQFLIDQAAFTEGGGVGTAPVAPTAVNLQALIQNQVNSAAQLASLLKQLQTKGLNVANLTELAGQGAGGIPIAQALLESPELINQLNDAQQQIADITQQTADKMTAAAFGDKVLRMSEALDRLLVHLQTWVQGLGLTTSRLEKESDEFIAALRRLNNALQGIGVPGGTVGEGGGQGNNPNITVNVNVGPGADGGQIGKDVRDALLLLKNRNLTTGL